MNRLTRIQVSLAALVRCLLRLCIASAPGTELRIGSETRRRYAIAVDVQSGARVQVSAYSGSGTPLTPHSSGVATSIRSIAFSRRSKGRISTCRYPSTYAGLSLVEVVVDDWFGNRSIQSATLGL
jgi:hypothetical protein